VTMVTVTSPCDSPNDLIIFWGLVIRSRLTAGSTYGVEASLTDAAAHRPVRSFPTAGYVPAGLSAPTTGLPESSGAPIGRGAMFFRSVGLAPRSNDGQMILKCGA
jgi:hypothetical protein